jgi:hypothetical protein
MNLNIKCLGGAWTSFVLFALVNFFPIPTQCLQDLFSAWLDAVSKNKVLIVILWQTSRQIGSSSCLEDRWNGRTLPEIVTTIYSPDSFLHLKVFVHFILKHCDSFCIYYRLSLVRNLVRKYAYAILGFFKRLGLVNRASIGRESRSIMVDWVILLTIYYRMRVSISDSRGLIYFCGSQDEVWIESAQF